MAPAYLKGEPLMLALRKQLAVAATSLWLLVLIIDSTQLARNYMDNGVVPIPFVFAQLVHQILFWLGVVFAAGAVVTHILMVRDAEMYEVGDESVDVDGLD